MNKNHVSRISRIRYSLHMKTRRSFFPLIFGSLICLFAAFTVRAATPLPNTAIAGNYFFNVTSNFNSTIWIAPPTWKVSRDTIAPSATNRIIDLSAARNEYEPVQIVTRTSIGGTRSLNLGASWSGPSGNVITATLHDVAYGVGVCAVGEPDNLNPANFGAGISVCAGNNQVFWLTVYVPTNAAPGIYSNTLTCFLSGFTTTIPIRVRVFNFTLPAQVSFSSLVNWSFSGTSNDAFVVKKWFADHRLTPTPVTWPSAMQHTITWDSGANPLPCGGFYDENNVSPQFSIRWLADQYIAGNGFNNGVGFPNFIAEQFNSSVQPRPSTFCGQSITGDPRGADYGTTNYNNAWKNFLAALQKYCDPTVATNSGGNPFGRDYLSKAIYYVMNEPQTAADYNLAAWLATLSRQAAPKLRLMISEEAKPEIYDNPLYPGQGYDIWLARLENYAVAMGNSLLRRRDHGEQTWWYSLSQDDQNFLNPNLTSHPAIDTRILAWLAWNQRVEGWASSSSELPLMTFVNSNSLISTIRAELLRESFEDYEYFKLANGGRKPEPFQPNAVDNTVSLIANSLTGFDRDPTKLHWLRDQLGRQISGETNVPPLLSLPSPRPYDSYYLNFGPGTSQITVGGHTWLPVNWATFSDAAPYYGWYFSDGVQLTADVSATYPSANKLQATYLYDDYGRQNTFVFSITNGVYDIEVGLGRPAGTSQGLVTINGVDIFGNRPANVPDIVSSNATKTKRIAVASGRLVMEVGQPVNGDYNFLDYMVITEVSPWSPDGLDDLWQVQNFGTATNALAAPTADPDGDGANNWAEFHFGTNPNSNASRPLITASLPTPGTVQLQWSSATNHVFRVDQSTNLINWTIALDQKLATNFTTTAILTRATNAPRGFYRITPITP